MQPLKESDAFRITSSEQIFDIDTALSIMTRVRSKFLKGKSKQEILSNVNLRDQLSETENNLLMEKISSFWHLFCKIFQPYVQINNYGLTPCIFCNTQVKLTP